MPKSKSLPITATVAASITHQPSAQVEASTSRPKRTVTQKSISRSRRTIIDLNDSEEDGHGREDQMDFDDDPLNEGQFTTFKTTTKIFKEVAIPMGRSTIDGSVYPGRRVAATSPSSLSSIGSSVREQSSGYDTPGTSAVATPAEPAVKRSLSLAPLNKSTSTSPPVPAKVNSSVRAQQLRSSKLSLNSITSKRKRQDEVIEEDEDETADARLARTLQEEEYQGGGLKRGKFADQREIGVENSSDESDSLSSLSSHDAVIPSRRNTKKGARFSLPTRAARDSAKKSIKEKATITISDTEKSDLTIFDSDEFRTDESVFENDEGLSEDEIVPTVSENQVAVAVATPRRRRRINTRATAAAGTTRQTVRSRMTNRAFRERMKLENAHPEIKTMWDTLKDIPVISPNRAEQPQAITRKLKSFQLEGLDWMMQQEKSQWKGGLLGDEMGMGKTIQAVSLIMSDYPAKEPTLVVVPPVALMQWQSEIKEYTDGKLKVLIHHNSNPKVKTLKRKDLRAYDVIMISYAGLESMYRKESKGWKRDDGILKEDSVIHSIKFHRLILDEAHSIKARTTGVAKACFALKADYKWCLSGTPVQNRIGEFFSLMRFLEVKPFACYFCKVCKCAELHWSQSADMKCTHCHHRGFDHVSIFNQELLTPITQGESPEIRREALDKLRLITDRIMLRRLKRDYTASMELPPKEVIIHQEFFGEIERDFSSSIMTNTHRQFDTYVSRGVMLNNYANIFGLIMQMRQVANHPDLILKKHAEGGQNVLICSICDEPAEEAIRSRCHHEFCRKCAKDYVRSFGDTTNGEPDCPRCHIPLSIDFDQPDIEQDEEHVKKNSIINRIKMEDWTSSTKIEMLVYDLWKLRSQKRTHKSIVFSQFTSMLQLVEWRLRRAGFNTVMLDGSMSPSQRQKSIEYFMNNTDVEVFLVSLKAGGVALNLTEASQVFIIDPWWNPSVEWQSADRCHRIGQKRPCVITRLCIEDSVESRMVLLQEKKANMINGTINNDQVAMEKLTPEDMQFLFRGS